jgi:hypothetical protein
MKYRTVKQYAQELLVRVNYVDAYKRNVGLDYRSILLLLKKEFPRSNTTIKELQKIAYSMNGSNVRLPVRRRSRRILARDFARSLLLFEDNHGMGLSYQVIASRVKTRFPDTPKLTVCQVRSTAGHLSRAGKPLPIRPGRKS